MSWSSSRYSIMLLLRLGWPRRGWIPKMRGKCILSNSDGNQVQYALNTKGWSGASCCILAYWSKRYKEVMVAGKGWSNGGLSTDLWLAKLKLEPGTYDSRDHSQGNKAWQLLISKEKGQGCSQKFFVLKWRGWRRERPGFRVSRRQGPGRRSVK
jgi:hypothetical protein